MKKLLLVTLMLLMAAPMVYGRWVTAKGNWDIPFNVPGEEIANDFHVEGIVLSRNNEKPKLEKWWVKDDNGNTWWMNGECITQDPADPKQWHFGFDFKTDGDVKQGQVVHFGFTFTVDLSNDIWIEDAWWTRDGKRIGPAVPIGGFSIDLIGGTTFSNTVTMRNDMADTVVALDTLEFAVTDTEVPLEAMDRDGLGVPGERGSKEFSTIEWRRFPTPLVLKPKETFKIDLKSLGLQLEPGKFLQIRANDTHTKLPSWWQHED